MIVKHIVCEQRKPQVNHNGDLEPFLILAKFKHEQGNRQPQ